MAFIRDDQTDIRMMVKAALKNLGVKQIVEAVDGLSALKILRERAAPQTEASLQIGQQAPKERINIVIADWQMPDMTGLELLQEVRRDKILYDTPFCMLTGERTLEYVQKAIAAGVDSYLIKPFSVKELEEKVQLLLKRGKSTMVTEPLAK